MTRAALIGLLALAPLPAVAEPAAEPLGVAALMRMTGGLLLVVALVFATAWAVRRFGRLPNANSHQLQLLGGVAVGQRERVVLIRAGQQQLVLGVAPGRVQLLLALEDDAIGLPVAPRAAVERIGGADTIAAAANGAPDNSPTGGSFHERLVGLLRRSGER